MFFMCLVLKQILMEIKCVKSASMYFPSYILQNIFLKIFSSSVTLISVFFALCIYIKHSMLSLLHPTIFVNI